MKYEKLAINIVRAVGGKGNIKSVTHCVTRLRFILKDEKKALPVKETKKIQGVTECLIKSGQYQVVIGPEVEDVYDEVMKLGEFGLQHSQDKKNTSIFSKLINMLQQCIAPIIGPMAGTAMVKALLQILVVLGLLAKDSQTYMMLNMISDGLFYFMPFYFAHSAAKYFGANGYVTMVIAGAMLHPTWSTLVSAGEAVSIFGLPIKLVTYSSTFMPILLIAFFQSYVEKFAKKVSPSAVRIFLVPMITVFITSIVAFVILGPVGFYIGDVLANVVMWINNRFSWLVVALVAGLWPLLVMTGMHSSLMPIQAVERTTLGYATIMTPAGIIANMSQAAATFAVAVRSKNKERKSLAVSTSITALCGVTEPALYGINLPLKRPLIASIIGGACGGLISGIFKVKAWGSGSSNIFSLPIFIGEDQSFMYAIIMIATAMLISFILSLILFKEPQENEEDAVIETQENEEKEGLEINKAEVFSPLIGKKVELQDVKDDTFNSGAMGKGIAIEPENNVLVAPVNGTIEMLFKTNHAVGMLSEDGIEVLMHIGLETVNLNGKHFEALVSQGDTVKKGTPLIRFDREIILEKGYDLTTPVIITNCNEYLDVIDTDASILDHQSVIMTIIK